MAVEVETVITDVQP